MKLKWRTTESVFAGALALSSHGAWAQENAGDSDEQQARSANTIVVTAQFREQSVQDTPLAISALNAELLEQKGVTGIVDAANIAPNVQLSSNAGNFGGMAAIFIRGVGQADPHFAVEPGVGMYVDDVYFGVLTGSLFELLDVDRIEVLRGPQGTLAGKNSIGGAVRLFSIEPGPTPDAFVEVGYGSRNSLTARAASNITLADGTLYGRFSVGSIYSEGYLDRLDYGCATGNFSGGSGRTNTGCVIGRQGGREVFTARGSLLFTPGDVVENLLSFDVTRDRSQNPAAKLYVKNALWTSGNDYITGAHDYTNYENYISLPTGGSSAGVPFVMSDTTPVNTWGLSNRLTIDLADDIALTSISAYRSSDSTFNATLDASPASVIDQVWQLEHEQFTQELRLSGSHDILDWTVGGYYYDASGTSGGRVNIPGGLAPGGGGLDLDILFSDPVKTRSASVFAHTVWHPLPDLNLTAAIRYTDDRKSFTFNRFDIDGSPHPVLGSLVNLPVEYSGNRTDYRLGIDYAWTPDFMTYAQVSTGYKGGGVNPRPFIDTQAVPYDPETLTAFEAGFKSQFADGRITLNAAAFFNDYTNFQATLLACDSLSPFPGFPCTQSTNVGDAEIRGFELEMSAEPVDGLLVDGTLGYLDFKYTRVDPATGITLDMTNVYTPEWTASAGIQYEIGMSGGSTLTPRMDLSYRSSIQGEAINSAVTRIDGLTLLGARLTWESADEDWQAQLSVRNLTDKFYYNSNFGRAGPPYFAAVGIVGEPRTFMFTVRRRFD